MSTSGGSQGDVFDVRKIRRLVELMNEHDLAEIDLRQADQRIRLRRGGDPPQITASPSVAAPGQLPPTTVTAAGIASRGEVAGQASEPANLTLIKSPMVGTFYASSSPEAEPFVKVGDRVNEETTVCIVEAMKVFNEIPAECSGQIVAMLVQNGDPVEYGQPLFKVDPGA
ncbi:MAG: acetyl-CoA carboxylase biotin carboxyl carrier protein [Pirellulales bacterium]